MEAGPTASSNLQPARLRLVDYGLAGASGLLLTLAQQPAGLGFLAWCCWLPLLLAIADKSWLQRAGLGLLAAMVWSWTLVGYWLVAAFREVPLGLLPSLLLTQAIIALSGTLGLVVFACLYRNWRRQPWPAIALPATWVAIEYGRAHLIGGSPWCLLGHTQSPYPLLIQIADVSGVYGVSFVVGSANILLASWWLSAPRRRANRWIATSLILFTLGYGWVRLQEGDGSAERVAVQAVHPAWPRQLGEAPQQRLADLIRLSREAASDASALLVWPENSLRFHLQDGGELSEEFVEFVQHRRQYVVAGLHRYERDAGTTRYYNSAVVVAPEGSVVGVADKRLLVPVAEAHWRGLPSVDPPFSPGKPWAVLSAGKRKLGILMCFESIFAEPARALVQQGAELLINPSNDALLGDGAAQLAAMAVFRSVENHVPLVHSGTVGITQIVDSHGRVVASASGAPLVLTATVATPRGGTVYTKIGDVFAMACIVVSLLHFVSRRGTRTLSKPWLGLATGG